MCGIWFIISQEPEVLDWDETDLSRRGPDHTGRAFVSVACACKQRNSCGCFRTIGIISTVLHVRGERLVRQPVVDDSGSNLAWNGEVFGLAQRDVMDVHFPEGSDTLFMSSSLHSCGGNSVEIFDVLNNIHGPFAVVYYHPESKSIYFARDSFGRRSLIWMRTDSNDLVVSSIFPLTLARRQIQPLRFGEVPADGLFLARWKENQLSLTFFPWKNAWSNCDSVLENPDLLQFKKHNDTVLHFVSLDQELSIDKADSFASVISLVPENSFFELANTDKIFHRLLDFAEVRELIAAFEDVLRRSIAKRIQMANCKCRLCTVNCDHTKIAVLFSGGIDSFIMTFLALQILPQGSAVDLLNVAFVDDGKTGAANDAPDRKTGLAGYRLLLSRFPNHKIRFVIIDITKSEVEHVRRNRLWYLLLPQESVLDSSLGTALWFAARGEGLIMHENGCAVPYTSPARIVFSGLGADEILGGYSRHRARFQSRGEYAACAEMLMDLRRIGSRNCGRDDRIISDHGREVRYPFLDEDLINFVLKLPLRSRCDFRLPRGIGDKLLLRLLAVKLDLEEVASLEKRALQFGTRIAKIDKSKNGSDLCPVLCAARNDLKLFG